MTKNIWLKFNTLFLVVFLFCVLGRIMTSCGSIQQVPVKQNLIIGKRGSVNPSQINEKDFNENNSQSESNDAAFVGIKEIKSLVKDDREDNSTSHEQSIKSNTDLLSLNHREAFIPSLNKNTSPTDSLMNINDQDAEKEKARRALGKRKAIIGIILTVISIGGIPIVLPLLLNPFGLAYCIRALKLLKKGESGRRWAKLGIILSVILWIVLILGFLLLLEYL